MTKKWKRLSTMLLAASLVFSGFQAIKANAAEAVESNNLFNFDDFMESNSKDSALGAAVTYDTTDKTFTVTGTGDCYTRYAGDNLYKMPVTPESTYRLTYNQSSVYGRIMVFGVRAKTQDAVLLDLYRDKEGIIDERITIPEGVNEIFIRYGILGSTERISCTFSDLVIKEYDLCSISSGNIFDYDTWRSTDSDTICTDDGLNHRLLELTLDDANESITVSGRGDSYTNYKGENVYSISLISGATYKIRYYQSSNIGRLLIGNDLFEGKGREAGIVEDTFTVPSDVNDAIIRFGVDGNNYIGACTFSDIVICPADLSGYYQTVKKGTALKEVPVPANDKPFHGWFSDESLKTFVDSNTIIQSNTVLYPKYCAHDWKYSVSNGKLNVVCKEDNNESAALTVNGPATPVYYGAKLDFSVGTDRERAAWEKLGVEVPEVTYTDAEGATLLKAPTAAGDYVASVSPVGVVASSTNTVKVAFTILPGTKEDYEATNDVIDKINAIGTVEFTEECKAAIDTARTAYDALTEDQKSLITEEIKEILVDAEANYDSLEKAETPNPQDPQNPQDTQNPQDSQNPQDIQKPQDTQNSQNSQNPQDTQKPVDNTKPEENIIKNISYKTDSHKKTVKVPASYKEGNITYVVVSIAKDAFNGKYTKKVILPATVKKIESRAFDKDNKLRNIKINSVKIKVSKTAFKGIKKANKAKIKVTVTKKMSKKDFKALKKNLVKQGLKAKNIVRK